jgi:hypothetical protein
MASASLILYSPEEALVRPVRSSFDPTPSFGPQFHFTRGPEVIAYPRTEPDRLYTELFSFAALCCGFAAGFMGIIPGCQRVLVLLKLLD